MGEPVAARVPQLYDVNEVGRILHRHPQTVRNLIREGELDYVQIGRSKMVRDDQLADYIERQSVTHDDDGVDTRSHPAAARLSRQRPAPPPGKPRVQLRELKRNAP